MTKKMSIGKSKDGVAFDIFNYMFLILIGFITLYPILNVLAVSFSSYSAYLESPLMVFPRDFSIEAYKSIFSNPIVVDAYKNTIFVTIVGTMLSLLFTLLTAYPLAKEKVRGARLIMFFITFTMMFSGGTIPTYLVMKNLKLIDTLWALIVPSLVSAYNFIILRNFIESIPDSIEESARIDGAGTFRILFQIIVPLSIPVLATLVLFCAVGYWNNYREALIYINTRSKWTLSLLLKEIITESTSAVEDPLAQSTVYEKTIQSATIIVTIVPILLVYPFVQKYFIKGIMIGSVKG